MINKLKNLRLESLNANKLKLSLQPVNKKCLQKKITFVIELTHIPIVKSPNNNTYLKLYLTERESELEHKNLSHKQQKENCTFHPLGQSL